MTRIAAASLLAGIALLVGCAEQDTFGTTDEVTLPDGTTSTTLRIDRPDDTADPSAPLDVTSPVDEPTGEQPQVNAVAVVLIDAARYELEVAATDCGFDLAGVWDVNGTTTVDDVPVGFSTSYQLTPGVDGAADTWELFVYLSFDLGERGVYQHHHDTSAEASVEDRADAPAPQQRRPQIDASPGRLRVRAEFIDPTGLLVDAGETTPGRVDVTCT